MLSRGIEKNLLLALPQMGVSITAYGVLSRGLISESRPLAQADPKDFRAHLPRFQGDNLRHNLGLVEALTAIAREKGLSVAQLAIAWVAAQGRDVVPLIGAQKIERVSEAFRPRAVC